MKRLKWLTLGGLTIGSWVGLGGVSWAVEPQPNASRTLEIRPREAEPSIDATIAPLFPDTFAPASPEAAHEAEQSGMALVTSVSQLSDVQPTDWAFPALQALIEKYGCLAGYPSSTFQGNRVVSRYEFAAGLNACVEQLTTRIAAFPEFVSKNDLETLEKLQASFQTELALLNQQVDRLTTRVEVLESQAFSTTTKFVGQVVVAVNSGGFSGDRILSPTGVTISSNQPNATILYRVALDFNTSFTGTDLLKIRLDTGSNGALDNAAGLLEPNFGSVLDFSVKPPTSQTFGLGRLLYTFRPVKDLAVTLGPGMVVTDHVDRNRYAHLSFRDFTTQVLVQNNLLFPINGRNTGAALDWKPGAGDFSLRATYVAGDAGNPSSPGTFRGMAPFVGLLYPVSGGNPGFFGQTHQGTIELEYATSRTFALRLLYSGGNIFTNRFDALGVNTELALSSQLGLFGRYGYGSYSNTSFGNINPQYWMVGLSMQDLFKKGSLAGIAAGQPFIENDVGNATQTNFEVFYNFPVNDNIRITPLVQVITNAGNRRENGAIITGTIRTVFSF